MCQSKQKIELISEKELRNTGNISRLSFILWKIEGELKHYKKVRISTTGKGGEIM